MSRYIDADRLKEELKNSGYCNNNWLDIEMYINNQPTADVRENVKSEKIISGGSADSDGATLWFRCSACDGSVDISDNFCKHCGADMRGEA